MRIYPSVKNKTCVRKLKVVCIRGWHRTSQRGYPEAGKPVVVHLKVCILPFRQASRDAAWQTRGCEGLKRGHAAWYVRSLRIKMLLLLLLLFVQYPHHTCQVREVKLGIPLSISHVRRTFPYFSAKTLYRGTGITEAVLLSSPSLTATGTIAPLSLFVHSLRAQQILVGFFFSFFQFNP